jgi:hypothetical protein
VLTLTLTASAAHAHYTYVYNGADLMSVSSDHVRTSVCDQSANGRSARGWVRLRHTGQVLSLVDRVGGDCSTLSTPNQLPIDQFRLCRSSNLDCTAWRFA